MLVVVIIIISLFLITAFTGAPYVPSKKVDLKTAFTELYPLSKKDTLIDFGAGDGAVLKAAADYGAKTIGIELNPILALIAKLRTHAQIVCMSYYHYHFPPETTVVYLFGDSRDIKKMYTKIEKEAKRLNKAIYLISLGFPVPGQKIKKQRGAYYLYQIS